MCFLESPIIPFERIKSRSLKASLKSFSAVPVYSQSHCHCRPAEHLGMSREDILAIGDGMNDAEMLESFLRTKSYNSQLINM